MKNYRKAVEDRQRNILDTVLEHKEIEVRELADITGVSPMTVRRDLQLLESRGLLRRVYGKAISPDIAFPGGVEVIDRCRDAISAYAASLVADGDKLFINGSRTALNLLDHMKAVGVRVFTNNSWVTDKQLSDNVTVILSGGELSSRVMVGEYVLQNLLNLSADKTFIGCAAVYDDGEFRYDIPTEIGINEVMISRTKGKLFILADHTKLQRREQHANSYGSCRYDHDVTLITDDMADPVMVARLREKKINVIVVPTGRQTAGQPGDQNG